jgi:hypothetical protein
MEGMKAVMVGADAFIVVMRGLVDVRNPVIRAKGQ